MTQESKVPALRFKGFTDAWEQCELGEVAEFTKGKGYSKKDLQPDGDPIILYGRLYTNYETVISEVDTFVETQENSILSKGNEVIVPASGETAEDISRASVVEIHGIILGGDLNIIYPNENLDSTFLALTISNGNQQKELSKRAQGKSVVHLHNSDLKEVTLLYPSLKEQSAIGNFFRHLDDLITLQQRKLDKLKELKQGYLTEMFPAENQCKPKRRFAGFTNAWEQRELGDLVEFYSGLTYSPNDVQSQGTLVLRSSNVKDGEIVDADNVYVNPRVVNSQNITEGDIIVVVRNGSRSLIGKHAQVKEKKPNTVIGAFMTGIKSSQPEFTNALLDTQSFKNEVNMNLGATINQITGGMFSKMNFKVPTSQEQSAIGNFFRHLDDLITLQQRKLDKLKELKSSYLSEMFV